MIFYKIAYTPVFFMLSLGEIVYIPRITLYSKDNDLPFKLCRRQFPVVPAFAMTINKSQGQTLNRTILCLYKPVFAHGQLYVALSRVCTPDSLSIFLLPPSPSSTEQSPPPQTANIVYQQAFSNLHTYLINNLNLVS